MFSSARDIRRTRELSPRSFQCNAQLTFCHGTAGNGPRKVRSKKGTRRHCYQNFSAIKFITPSFLWLSNWKGNFSVNYFSNLGKICCFSEDLSLIFFGTVSKIALVEQILSTYSHPRSQWSHFWCIAIPSEINEICSVDDIFSWESIHLG